MDCKYPNLKTIAQPKAVNVPIIFSKEGVDFIIDFLSHDLANIVLKEILLMKGSVSALFKIAPIVTIAKIFQQLYEVCKHVSDKAILNGRRRKKQEKLLYKSGYNVNTSKMRNVYRTRNQMPTQNKRKLENAERGSIISRKIICNQTVCFEETIKLEEHCNDWLKCQVEDHSDVESSVWFSTQHSSTSLLNNNCILNASGCVSETKSNPKVYNERLEEKSRNTYLRSHITVLPVLLTLLALASTFIFSHTIRINDSRFNLPSLWFFTTFFSFPGFLRTVYVFVRKYERKYKTSNNHTRLKMDAGRWLKITLSLLLIGNGVSTSPSPGTPTQAHHAPLFAEIDRAPLTAGETGVQSISAHQMAPNTQSAKNSMDPELASMPRRYSIGSNGPSKSSASLTKHVGFQTPLANKKNAIDVLKASETVGNPTAIAFKTLKVDYDSSPDTSKWSSDEVEEDNSGGEISYKNIDKEGASSSNVLQGHLPYNQEGIASGQSRSSVDAGEQKLHAGDLYPTYPPQHLSPTLVDGQRHEIQQDDQPWPSDDEGDNTGYLEGVGRGGRGAGKKRGEGEGVRGEEEDEYGGKFGYPEGKGGLERRGTKRGERGGTRKGRERVGESYDTAYPLVERLGEGIRNGEGKGGREGISDAYSEHGSPLSIQGSNPNPFHIDPSYAPTLQGSNPQHHIDPNNVASIQGSDDQPHGQNFTNLPTKPQVPPIQVSDDSNHYTGQNVPIQGSDDPHHYNDPNFPIQGSDDSHHYSGPNFPIQGSADPHYYNDPNFPIQGSDDPGHYSGTNFPAMPTYPQFPVHKPDQGSDDPSHYNDPNFPALPTLTFPAGFPSLPGYAHVMHGGATTGARYAGACPARCACSLSTQQAGGVVVNCVGLELTRVPAGIPPETCNL